MNINHIWGGGGTGQYLTLVNVELERGPKEQLWTVNTSLKVLSNGCEDISLQCLNDGEPSRQVPVTTEQCFQQG